jgi:sec-independent protein translocase protein TatC
MKGTRKSRSADRREPDNPLPFLDHLSELRRRLFVTLGAVVVGAAVAYAFIDRVVVYLTAPASGIPFLALSPPELFLTYVRISCVLGLAIALPVAIYQMWAFVRPALTRAERRFFLVALTAGTTFFLIGVVFAYLVILPIAVEFFAGFSSEIVASQYSFSSYTGFVLSTILAFGIAFELPILLSALVRLGLVSIDGLKKSRKYVVLAIAFGAALLTPPDVVSQLLLAGPMYLLYEVSILISSVRAHNGSRS